MKREVRTFAKLVQRIHYADDLDLQRIVQAPQVFDFGNIVEIQTRPTLAKNESVRIIGNLAQPLDITVVSRLIDRAGEVLVSLDLVGLTARRMEGLALIVSP